MSEPPESSGVTIQTPIWKHILWAAVALGGLWCLSQIPNTLVVFSMAWLISYLLNPMIDAIQGRRLGPIQSCSRNLAVSIVAGLLIGFAIAGASLVLPQLSDQVQRLVQVESSISDPQELAEALKAKVDPLLDRIPEKYRAQAIERASNSIQGSTAKIGEWVSNGIGWLGTFLGEMISGVFLVLTAFLFSLYMLQNWHGMSEGFLEKLPRQYRDEVISLSRTMNKIFGGYLKATILTGIACMIATFLSLIILSWMTGHEFPYKYIVSFVAGLTYPVPVIGIMATSILGGVLGYIPENNLGFGFAVLVTINIVNMIIDRTVQPKLMSDAIGVSELFVMFAAFAGGEVAGIWGMLLGIPVAAMGKALFEWFHEQFLVVEELTDQERAAVRGEDPEPEPKLEPETETGSAAKSESDKTEPEEGSPSEES